MKSNILLCLALIAEFMVQPTQAAPFMRPPAFLGGIPGKAQFQSILMQRHQARTLLYREALEELRKNPQAADVPECPAGGAPAGVLCLAKAVKPAVEPVVPAVVPPAVKPVVPAVVPPAVKPVVSLAAPPVVPPVAPPVALLAVPAVAPPVVKPAVPAVAPPVVKPAVPAVVPPVVKPVVPAIVLPAAPPVVLLAVPAVMPPVAPLAVPAVAPPVAALPSVPAVEKPVKQEAITMAKEAKMPVAEPEAKLPKTVKPVGRRIAVLFGINSYKDPIPELGTPVTDVEGIADVLKSRYGYETRVLKNVGKAGIINALNAVAAEATPEDRVLLFYAGHGYLMDDTNMGYWIPVDASVKTAANWISNTDISKLLSAISARQLILVSDSCFSGSLTKEQKVTGGVTNPEIVLQRRSVLAFSSGGEEPVSDGGKEGHSIFAWSFINTLQSAKGIAPGFEIYNIVHGQVMKDFPQEPQYGAVLSAGHTVGGEYIFDAVRP